ncbi:MAG: bifunctional 23S rRNA (guanine(2069)-N(7))-methyltransferase RlmK/23S rRNA (guanine(2445)-N(2))-methyltransferase RlmL [Nannocystaceae bacterium]
MLSLFATTAKGLEELVAAELDALGASDVRLTRAGVAFTGDLTLAYRCCLWSRLASRILIVLAEVTIADVDELHAAALAIPWEEHLTADGSLVVDFSGAGVGITHTQFGAQRIKDAVVDRFLARGRARPSVDHVRPDLRIHAHLRGERLTIAIDLAGESLHRRGYRGLGAEAPLKETLAAALLVRAGWPALAAAGAPLLDPMCGSGTLLIEAAWIAGDRAPGLMRPDFGFHGWRGHVPRIWASLLVEARERAAAGRSKIPLLLGSDRDLEVVRVARANLDRADLRGLVTITVRDLAELAPPPEIQGRRGLVITNPPYGERLGRDVDLPALHQTLGERLLAGFEGWEAAVLVADPALGKAMGLRARRYYNVFNGAIACRLLLFTVDPEATITPPSARPVRRSEGLEAVVNRVRKNQRALAPWLRKEAIECYRVYDADIPEYAVALDVYGTERDGVYAVLQEYAPPAEIEPAVAAQRLREAEIAAAEALSIAPDRIFVKVRRKQRRGDQYQRSGHAGEEHVVREGPARLLVNLGDYLDTGLYLDHRPVRAWIRELARGQDVLNLFAYTAAASVHAALGGAATTTSVDLSPRTLEWASRNFALNGLDRGRNRLHAGDVREFLHGDRRRYGLIYVDPPTFSNSKRAADFDVQAAHVALLHDAASRLVPGGVLIFSTHHRRFRLDEAGLAPLEIEDRSAATIPRDFARSPKIHRCWRLRWPARG